MSKGIGLLLVFLMIIIIITIPVSAFTEIGQNSWVSKASMQQARSSLGAVVVDGKIYVIGGSTQSYWPFTNPQGVVGTNEEYDPATDTWNTKTPMLIPRAGFAAASYQGKIYCIGGYTSNGTIVAVNQVYDPATDRWETKSPMPTARAYLQANVVNGTFYLIGGFAATDKGYTASNLNEVYDPATDTWTQRTPAIYGSYDYASAALDGKIYVICGSDKYQQTTWNQIYDTQTDTWKMGSSAPSYFMYGSAVATTGIMAPKRIYVFDSPAPDLATNPNAPSYSNQVYNPETDSWIPGADLPTSRADLAVAIENDKIYTIGGYSAIYRNVLTDYAPEISEYGTVEQYTPFGYGTVPSAVSIVSLQNLTSYASSDVPLNFSLNKPAAWVGYSLDGKDNITLTDNTTLTGLSTGLHNITVYAKDANENIGASETIAFTIAPVPLITASTAIAVTASVAVACLCLLLYFRKHKG